MINIAQYGILIILGASLGFHFLILLKIIPYNIVWGGRFKSDTEMVRFEIVSIFINLFFLFVIVVHSNFLTIDFPNTLMTIILWIMAALFALNTVGNVMSKNRLERILFTPVTSILSIFSVILALGS